MISSNKYILIVIKEEEFKDNYMKVLEGLTLHMDRIGANFVVELYSR